jgi:hypothetical protein
MAGVHGLHRGVVEGPITAACGSISFSAIEAGVACERSPVDRVERSGTRDSGIARARVRDRSSIQ